MHLTYAGNAALAQAVGTRVGGDDRPRAQPERVKRYVTSGISDRATRRRSSRSSPRRDDYGEAGVIASNRDEMAAVGAHVGTRQVLRNDRAPDGRTAVIFGDSYALAAPHYQGLAWFLTQAFREVHFLWAPFGWDPAYAAAAGAEVVICQGAERFRDPPARAGRSTSMRSRPRRWAGSTALRRPSYTSASALRRSVPKAARSASRYRRSRAARPGRRRTGGSCGGRGCGRGHRCRAPAGAGGRAAPACGGRRPARCPGRARSP